jgi:competence protein ComEA
MGDVPDLPVDRRRLLAVALGAVALLVLATRAFSRSGHATVPPPVRVAHAAAPAKAKLVYVDVVGAVRRPGLYRVPTGARVADAVARAGGVTRKAALALVNLAALVADGEQVVVPLRGEAVVGASAGGAAAPSGPVHLNSATIEQLDALPASAR